MNTQEVEFDPWGPKKLERAWVLNVNLQREVIPVFCAALEDVMVTHRGGVFYYPNIEEDCTRCRYDWFLRCRRDTYGLRVSLAFDTKCRELTQVKAFLSLGPRLVSSPDIRVTRRTENQVLKAIRSVLTQANDILDGKTEPFYPLFYIKLPSGQWISKTEGTEQGTFYRSAHNPRNGEIISAVAIKTMAYVKAVARARALPTLNKLTALMSLLADTPIVMARPSLPKRSGFHAIQKQPPAIEKVYPPSYHLWEPPSPFRDIKDTTASSMSLLAHENLVDNSKLWQSIYAYATAQDVQKEHPTLASVAYIASLSTLTGPTMCSGTVSCSVCGVRPPHPLLSEPDCIAKLISNDLDLESDPEKKEQIYELVRAVYSKQRSAYVHDAVLRHHEETAVQAQVGRPGKLSPVAEELTFAEQLTGIRRLARRVLLMKLPKTKLVQSLIEESSELTIVPKIPIVASVIVGRHPVGIKMHP